MQQFLGGLLTSESLWQTLKTRQRFRQSTAATAINVAGQVLASPASRALAEAMIQAAGHALGSAASQGASRRATQRHAEQPMSSRSGQFILRRLHDRRLVLTRPHGMLVASWLESGLIPELATEFDHDSLHCCAGTRAHRRTCERAHSSRNRGPSCPPCQSGHGAINRRLAELDREWDIERTLEANASTIAATGAALALFVNRRFALVPLVVGRFCFNTPCRVGVHRCRCSAAGAFARSPRSTTSVMR